MLVKFSTTNLPWERDQSPFASVILHLEVPFITQTIFFSSCTDTIKSPSLNNIVVFTGIREEKDGLVTNNYQQFQHKECVDHNSANTGRESLQSILSEFC